MASALLVFQVQAFFVTACVVDLPVYFTVHRMTLSETATLFTHVLTRMLQRSTSSTPEAYSLYATCFVASCRTCNYTSTHVKICPRDMTSMLPCVTHALHMLHGCATQPSEKQTGSSCCAATIGADSGRRQGSACEEE